MFCEGIVALEGNEFTVVTSCIVPLKAAFVSREIGSADGHRRLIEAELLMARGGSEPCIRVSREQPSRDGSIRYKPVRANFTD